MRFASSAPSHPRVLISVIILFITLPLWGIETQIAVIEDPALQQGIAEALGMDPGAAITVAELRGLQDLRVRSAGIRSLAGIEGAENLVNLDVRDNSITELSPLGNLSNLKELNIRENPGITSLQPLEPLTDLQYLNINMNYRIKSIVPLQDMKHLEALLMRSVPVLHDPREQEVIRSFSQLQRLNVRDTGLPSVAILIDGLEDGLYRDQLDIQENPIRDTDALAPFRASLSDFNAPVSPILTGRLRANAGFLYGLDNWPQNPEADGIATRDLFSGSALYDMRLRLTLDYELRSFLRVFSTIQTRFDGNAITQPPFEFNELFVEYATYRHTRVRLGQQSMSWTETLLFDDPGDVVEDLDDSPSLRVDHWLNRSRLTTVVAMSPAYVVDGENPAFSELTYAMRYRQPIGPVTSTLIMRYQEEDRLPVQSAGYIGATLGPFQMNAGAVARFDPKLFPNGDGWYVTNLQWTSPDAVHRVQLEYVYESRILNGEGHKAGIHLRRRIPQGWTSSLSVQHAFWDNSGVVIPQFERAISPYLTLTASAPIVYGDISGHFRDETDIPGNRTAAMKVNLGFEVTF